MDKNDKLYWRMKVLELRGKTGMNQDDLATKLGISIGTVSRWECGHAKPTPAMQRQLERLERKAQKQ